MTWWMVCCPRIQKNTCQTKPLVKQGSRSAPKRTYDSQVLQEPHGRVCTRTDIPTIVCTRTDISTILSTRTAIAIMVQHTACSVYELLAGTGVVLLKLPHGQCTAMLLLPSPPPTKHPHTLQLDAVPCSFEGIQSWAHIKEHADRRARGSGRSAVEIDHVANLFPTAVDYPVVTIKRQCKPKSVKQTGLGAVFSRTPPEALELWCVAHTCVYALPRHDFTPRALVHRVVDVDNGRHVVLPRVPAFPLHGIEEHVLRRVHPYR
mmetsp:Transcript_6430/g.20024  ORF Transcript_6430/g.20024 Transcript_6430/m.20024 type:complete len:262 (+) Transcript_6430:53-838(+)